VRARIIADDGGTGLDGADAAADEAPSTDDDGVAGAEIGNLAGEGAGEGTGDGAAEDDADAAAAAADEDEDAPSFPDVFGFSYAKLMASPSASVSLIGALRAIALKIRAVFIRSSSAHSLHT